MKEQSKQHYKIETFDENIFNVIPFGIDIVDENLDILYINEMLADYVGREAAGRKCYMVYKDDKRQCLNCPLKEPIKAKEGNTIEIDGVMGKRIFKITHRNINFKGKNAILEVFEDITEKKKIESHLLRAQRMDSIGTLAGGIAHDINNVLTPILMAVQILQSKLSDDHSRWMLSTLESSARRGADIVKQVLTFARGVEGERAIIQPAYLVGEMEKIIRETFPKSIRLITDIAENLWNLYGDATQIHQILLNLCVNARDAMPGGGALMIAVENMPVDANRVRIHPEAKAGKYVMIKVSDTGTGIPADVIDKIFEPFFTTKEIGKGTGLGLSTVQTIVKSHGGFLNVYSETGKGTTFSVYLPAAIDKAQHVKEDKIEMYQGNGELILVVDDELAIREIVKETLEMYGYKAITADDGKEAVMVYGQGAEKIKAVILDMSMPSMDGHSAIRILQNIDPQVKIIAVSGLMPDSKHGMDNSVNVQAYLHKPYTAGRLLKTLNDVLNK